MRLNIGGGTKRLQGWTNVDIAPGEFTDIVADACCIPIPDNTVEAVMAIHLVEHLFAWEVPTAIAEWFRVLLPSGRVLLEMPDLRKACTNIAEDYQAGKHPDDQGMWAIYGDDRSRNPLMMHKSGWWFERLRPIVGAAGFINVVEKPTKFHAIGRDRRDFRLEAQKPW